MNPDAVIHPSPAQKILRIKKLRVELAPEYSIIRTDLLKEILAKLRPVDRLKALVD